MGRPERPIEAGRDPVARLAADLRTLRQAAGSPTYREMAAKAHFSASALSQAAGGQRLPTLPVLLGFVEACGGDAAEWRRRWQEASAPPAAVPSPARPRRRWTWIPSAAFVAVTAIALAVTGSLPDQLHPSPVTAAGPPSPSPSPVAEGQVVYEPAQPVADGSDPKRSGCAADATTIATASLIFPARRLAGTVELRYSPSCSAAWTRFVPAPTGRGPGDTVTVVTVRPADAIRLPFTITYGDGAVYGDILLTGPGCVRAAASIVNNGKASPEVSTRCLAGPV